MLGTEEPEASEEAEPDEVGNLISQMNEKLSLLDGGAPHELEQRLKAGHQQLNVSYASRSSLKDRGDLAGDSSFERRSGTSRSNADRNSASVISFNEY